MYNKSTIWLDFLNFIVIPFHILTGILELVDIFKSNGLDIIKLIIFGLLIIYNVITFCLLLKRRKSSYYLLIGYIFLVLIIGLYNIYFEVTNVLIFVLIIILGCISWLLPNCIYIKKRKTLFYDHNVAHIKKCPGCNRIIPIKMASCGKCGYVPDNKK